MILQCFMFPQGWIFASSFYLNTCILCSLLGMPDKLWHSYSESSKHTDVYCLPVEAGLLREFTLYSRKKMVIQKLPVLSCSYAKLSHWGKFLNLLSVLIWLFHLKDVIIYISNPISIQYRWDFFFNANCCTADWKEQTGCSQLTSSA